MRVLFLAKRYYSGQDLLSGFGRYACVPRELERQGHSVLTIAMDQRNGSVASSCPHLHSYSPLRFLRLITSTARDFQPDVIVGGGHLYMGSLGLRLARRLGCPFVFDVYDLYPSFLGRFAWFGRPWFHRLLKRSDAISAASPALVRYASLYNNRVSVVRNATDEADGPRKDKKSARRKFGLPEKTFILGYVGGVADYVMLDECTRALEMLPNGIGKPIIAQIGPLPNAVPAHHNVRFLGNRMREEVPVFIDACDILLAPYRNCPQVEFSNACKLSEYAAARAVVVASRNGDWASYLPEDYPGLFDPDKPGDLAASLQRQMSANIPARPSGICFWDSSAAAMADLLERVCGTPHRLD